MQTHPSLIIWRTDHFPILQPSVNLIFFSGLLGFFSLIILTQIHFFIFKLGWWLPVASTNSSIRIFLLTTILYIFQERISNYLENLEEKVNERTVALSEA
ncbi:MAG: adenylate cyclase, partial [Crocosphaera sp.]